MASADQWNCNYTNNNFEFPEDTTKTVNFTMSQFRLGYDPQYPTRPDAYVVDFYISEDFDSFNHFFTVARNDTTTEFRCYPNMDLKIYLPFYGRLKGKVTDVVSVMSGTETSGRLEWNGSTYANGKEDNFSVVRDFNKGNNTSETYENGRGSSKVEWADELQAVCGNEINLRIRDVVSRVTKRDLSPGDSTALAGLKLKFVRFEFHAVNDGQGCK
ncbi:MAG: hypothetical protein EOP09_06760 [Proteobacteria bacterium]|nr:MAG: hypothetical protein EOP09_06760 [Pseudomonadota bacterium]